MDALALNAKGRRGGRLARYLRRLGLDEAPAVGRDGLAALLRAHLEAIPYENLDVVLGLVPSMEEDAIVEKLVERGRGGWCYEMNGVFAWALEALGFEVVRVRGAVNRHRVGPDADGNHLILVVRLPEGDHLADVGLGEGPRDPLPLVAGRHRDPHGAYALSVDRDGRWLLELPAGSGAERVDFRVAPATLAEMAPVAQRLATSPSSPFRRNVVLCRSDRGRVVSLTETRLVERSASTRVERALAEPAAWMRCVRERFALLPGAIGDLELDAAWRGVAARAAGAGTAPSPGGEEGTTHI